MSEATPRVTRVYSNHHLDSTRWEVYRPRPGDVVVTTSYKSGTTFTQDILRHLVHGGRDPLPDLGSVSPWVDARFHGVSREELAEHLEALPSPRFLKSHLPLDGLPWYPEVRYLVVARDARDVFMSLWNHYRSYTDALFARLNAPDAEGPPLARCPDDPRVLWRLWLTRGWFPWESEGWPFWSNLHHTASYWAFRHLPNLRFLHYADLLADLPAKVREIAEFCGIEASAADVARVAEATRFETVRKNVEAIPPESDPMAAVFEGGLRTFIHKGTNGRWRELLTQADLVLYEEAKRRVLSPDCARWLEQGGPVPA